MNQALYYVIDVLISLASFMFLARFLLQLMRVDFYNPISQGVVKLTDPVLKPLRMVIPGFRNVDFASFVVAWGVKFLGLLLIYAMAQMAWPSILVPVVTSFAQTLLLMLQVLKWSIIIVILASWIAPGNYHPGLALLAQITEPVMAPFRKLLPPMGGFDLSPILAFMVIQVLEFIIPDLLSRLF